MVLLENRFFGHNNERRIEIRPIYPRENRKREHLKIKKGDKDTFWVVTEEKV
jgi:hypothetical protein